MKELEILKNDAGNPIFVDVAEAYRRESNLDAAIEVCLKGLSANPSCHLGRLVLARVFFERGELPFAAREVRELCSALPEIESLKRLMKSLSPDAQESVPKPQVEAATTQNTVAEADFDLDEIDILEDDLKNN